jgi:hypothetical protein
MLANSLVNYVNIYNIIIYIILKPLSNFFYILIYFNKFNNYIYLILKLIIYYLYNLYLLKFFYNLYISYLINRFLFILKVKSNNKEKTI